MYSLPEIRVGIRQSEAKNPFLCGLMWLGKMYFYLDCPQRYKWHSPLPWVFLYVTVMTFLPMSSNRLKEFDGRYLDLTWKVTTPKRNHFHTVVTVLRSRAPCHSLQSPTWFSTSLTRRGKEHHILSFPSSLQQVLFNNLKTFHIGATACAEWTRMTQHSSCCHGGCINRIADDVSQIIISNQCVFTILSLRMEGQSEKKIIIAGTFLLTG